MSSLYIHIPFCAKRCFYCDFHSGTDNTLRDKYVDALTMELKMRIKELPVSTLNTIYIGGGTPSQLTPFQLKKIFSALEQYFNISQVKEITIEVNPDDITKDYLSSLRELPINRVSMGVQSFNDRLLNIIGRRHNSQKAVEAYTLLRESGVNNISIDLMFSLPTQTIEEWEESINQAISLQPQHISAYDLSYEPGSVLTQKLKRGEIEACSDETSIAMYNMLIDKLSIAGYEHYEISNFALQGYRSQHNSGYWSGVPYLGLGASAHSFDGVVRRANVSNTSLYINKVLSGENAFEVEELTLQDRYNETIFTHLRTSDGVDLSLIEKQFGKENLQHLLREATSYINDGYLKEVEGRVVLTRKGIVVSDSICCDLFL